MSENQTVEDYPCRRCQVFIGAIVASLNIEDSFQCERTFAHGVLGGGMQPEAATPEVGSAAIAAFRY